MLLRRDEDKDDKNEDKDEDEDEDIVNQRNENRNWGSSINFHPFVFYTSLEMNFFHYLIISYTLYLRLFMNIC